MFGMGVCLLNHNNVDHDPYFANVVSLLHFNGTNGSTTIADVKGKTWTANGNAQLSTAQSMFGGSSLLLDGSGDDISTPYSADFNIGSFTDYTVEGFFRLSVLTQGAYLFHLVGDSNNRSALIYDSVSDKISIFSGIAGVPNSYLSGVVSEVTDTWEHVAWVKIGGTSKIFFRGIEVYSGSVAYPNISSLVVLGSVQTIAPANYVNGNYDEVRITKNVARYTSGFTPPTRQFPDS